MAKTAKQNPDDRAGVNVLVIGFKSRVDKHYVSLVDGANFQSAFEAWLRDGKVKSGKVSAFVLKNGQQGAAYVAVVDFSDVDSVFTVPFDG